MGASEKRPLISVLPSLSIAIQIEADRAVVGALDLREDISALYAVLHPVGDKKIVYSPACVPLSGGCSVAPPGIRACEVGVEISEGIRKARADKLGELFALLIGEAGISNVFLRILEVYLLVSNVHVPADYDALILIQSTQIISESILPRHAEIKPLQFGLGIGCVYADKEKLIIFQSNCPALSVQLRDIYAVSYGKGRMLCENTGAGIALLLGIVPVGLIAFKAEVDLPFLQLCLLNAEKIRIKSSEALLKAFFTGSPEPVYIPGYKSHLAFPLASLSDAFLSLSGVPAFLVKVSSRLKAVRRFIGTPCCMNFIS